MIEIDYNDTETEAEWNAWYDGYVRDLVTVPGITTAQRFTTTSPGMRRYMAIYAVANLAAYETPRYRQIGGGGHASAKWHKYIDRRRNLFDGLEQFPEVGQDDTLLMTHSDPKELNAEDIVFARLEARDMTSLQTNTKSTFSTQVPFDTEISLRYLAITTKAKGVSVAQSQESEIALYLPSGPRVKSRLCKS